MRGDVTYEWRGGTDVRGHGPWHAHHRLRSQELAAAGQPLLRFPPQRALHALRRHRRRRGTSHRQRRHQSRPPAALCATYIDDSNWSAAGALMAGVSFRIDRGHRAPVSIKDSAAIVDEPGRLHVDLGYRFLYLGDAHTGNLVGTTFADARSAPRRHHGARASRRPAVGHPLRATRAPDPIVGPAHNRVRARRFGSGAREMMGWIGGAPGARADQSGSQCRGVSAAPRALAGLSRIVAPVDLVMRPSGRLSKKQQPHPTGWSARFDAASRTGRGWTL